MQSFETILQYPIFAKVGTPHIYCSRPFVHIVEQKEEERDNERKDGYKAREKENIKRQKKKRHRKCMHKA